MGSKPAGLANANKIPGINNIFDVSAEFLGQLRTWLEQNPPAVSVQSIIGYAQSTQASRVRLAANQSLANLANTVIPFATVDYDYGGLWDSTNKRLRIRLDGKYVIGAGVVWDANATGNRNMVIRRGTGNTTPSVGLTAATLPNLGAGSGVNESIVTSYDLRVDDTIDAIASQNSGGALNVLADTATNLWIVRVGP